jgi:hypothetical protein
VFITRIKGDKMLVPICPVCNGPAEDKDRVPFGVTKFITSGKEEIVERYLCGVCAAKESKREAARVREQAVAAAVSKALRDG